MQICYPTLKHWAEALMRPLHSFVARAKMRAVGQFANALAFRRSEPEQRSRNCLQFPIAIAGLERERGRLCIPLFSCALF